MDGRRQPVPWRTLMASRNFARRYRDRFAFMIFEKGLRFAHRNKRIANVGQHLADADAAKQLR